MILYLAAAYVNPTRDEIVEGKSEPKLVVSLTPIFADTDEVAKRKVLLLASKAQDNLPVERTTVIAVPFTN